MQVEQLQEEELLRSGRKHFRNVTKQQIDKKKERKQESSECEREIENVEKKMRYMKFLALSA